MKDLDHLKLPRAGETSSRFTKEQALAAQKFHQTLPGYSVTRLVELPALAKELGVKDIFVKDEASRFRTGSVFSPARKQLCRPSSQAIARSTPLLPMAMKKRLAGPFAAAECQEKICSLPQSCGSRTSAMREQSAALRCHWKNWGWTIVCDSSAIPRCIRRVAGNGRTVHGREGSGNRRG